MYFGEKARIDKKARLLCQSGTAKSQKAKEARLLASWHTLHKIVIGQKSQ